MGKVRRVAVPLILVAIAAVLLYARMERAQREVLAEQRVKDCDLHLVLADAAVLTRKIDDLESNVRKAKEFCPKTYANTERIRHLEEVIRAVRAASADHQ